MSTKVNPEASETNENWRENANCLEVNPDIFAGLTPEDVDRAKEVCGRCAVRQECLDFALDNPSITVGWIFGGATEEERRVMTHENL